MKTGLTGYKVPLLPVIKIQLVLNHKIRKKKISELIDHKVHSMASFLALKEDFRLEFKLLRPFGHKTCFFGQNLLFLELSDTIFDNYGESNFLKPYYRFYNVLKYKQIFKS